MNINNDPKWVDVTEVGDITKQQYFGRFCLRPFLTNGERTEASRLAEKYCRGIESNDSLRMFLTTMAFVKFHVVESDASWWKADGQGMFDQSPVFAIAERIAELQGFGKEEAKADEKNT